MTSASAGLSGQDYSTNSGLLIEPGLICHGQCAGLMCPLGSSIICQSPFNLTVWTGQGNIHTLQLATIHIYIAK